MQLADSHIGLACRASRAAGLRLEHLLDLRSRVKSEVGRGSRITPHCTTVAAAAVGQDAADGKADVELTFQDAIRKLQDYWASVKCLIW